MFKATLCCGCTGKMVCLERLLTAAISEMGDRVVVVCSSVKALDLIQGLCGLKAWKTARIDGSTSTDDRQDIVTSFNLHGAAKARNTAFRNAANKAFEFQHYHPRHITVIRSLLRLAAMAEGAFCVKNG